MRTDNFFFSAEVLSNRTCDAILAFYNIKKMAKIESLDISNKDDIVEYEFNRLTEKGILKLRLIIILHYLGVLTLGGLIKAPVMIENTVNSGYYFFPEIALVKSYLDKMHGIETKDMREMNKFEIVMKLIHFYWLYLVK
jgi:hypothetical protein